MAAPNPVTEIVEMNLIQTWTEFMPVFEARFLPILLAAPGIIDVRTGQCFYSTPSLSQFLTCLFVGPKVKRQGELEPRSIVSITQWESLEAHERFLKSKPAESFFAAMEMLLSGPPTVTHYKLGSFQGHEDLHSMLIRRSGQTSVMASPAAARAVSLTSKCIEDAEVLTQLSFFSDESAMMGALESGNGKEDFGVHVRSYGFARPGSRL
jgi:hypothetical protein